MTDDFTKGERQQLRELAGDVYEAEASVMLEGLAASFARWRSGDLLASELLQEIHDFHQHQSRELWSMYQGLRKLEIVARGLGRGLLDEDKLSPALREKLEPLIGAYRR